MSRRGYGIPLICPKCPHNWAYRILKTPHIKVPKCPDCESLLTPTDPQRRAAWEAKRQRAP